MKKIVVLIFVVMAALSAKAQFYVGGNVALWHNDDADNTSFLIEPEFGYNFSERWAVGAILRICSQQQRNSRFLKMLLVLLLMFVIHTTRIK